jgi:sugar phosphate isomerase/epimerase
MPNHVVVSTLGWSKQSLEEAVAGVAALEFGQIDLALHEGWAHVNPSELAAGGPAEVRRQAERVRGLIARHEMKRVAACNVGLRTADADEQQRRLEAVCDLARALEVPVITIGASKRGTPLDDEVARLWRLVPVAAERGVQLTVETHTNQVTELPADAVALCRAVDGLGLTLDASHFHAGPNQGANFHAVLPFVRHVHLRDARSDWAHVQVLAGSGLVDFNTIVRRLHELGYEGKFAIEYIDSLPIVAGEGEPRDVPANVLRMRDTFLAAERAAGIVRTPAAAAPAL